MLKEVQLCSIGVAHENGVRHAYQGVVLAPPTNTNVVGSAPVSRNTKEANFDPLFLEHWRIIPMGITYNQPI